MPAGSTLPFRRDNPWRGGFIDARLRCIAREVPAQPGTTIDQAREAHLARAYNYVTSLGEQDLHLEFGVREGNMINHLASTVAPSRMWHGFDSFQGLPQDKQGRDRCRYRGCGKPFTWKKGVFNVSMPAVRSNVRLHAGWFNETLPRLLDAYQVLGGDADRRGLRLAFAHMDADLYSSTYDVLDTLAARNLLRNGSILAFDELFGHVVVSNHEWRAVRDVMKRWRLKWRFITWMLHPQSKYGRAAIRVDGADDATDYRGFSVAGSVDLVWKGAGAESGKGSGAVHQVRVPGRFPGWQAANCTDAGNGRGRV